MRELDRPVTWLDVIAALVVCAMLVAAGWWAMDLYNDELRKKPETVVTYTIPTTLAP